MKKIFLSILLAVLTLGIYAAKSTGTVHVFTQPDGTQISVRLLGDEEFSWYQTTDGAILVRVDNYFYIAKTNSDGTLASTGVLAHNSEARTTAETTLIAAQDASLMKATGSSILKAKKKAIAGYPSSSFAPHMGEYHIPIIMMEYSNKKFNKSGEELKAEFEEYFNGSTKTSYSKETYLNGYSSMSQFFSDASQGKFKPVFDLYGPYTADNTHDYYGNKSGHSFYLLTEAVKKADGDIDFSQYDSNNDGNVDIVYILFAGTGANTSGDLNDFWPACWYGLGVGTDEGKRINVMGGSNELSYDNDKDYGTVRAGIGVFCHEMSHGLGLPDLYWTLGENHLPKDAQGYDDPNNCGPEYWDLMDGGENICQAIWPCQYTAWERDVMGWLDTDELTEPSTVTLYPLNKDGGKACRVTNPANKNEYYIIENYQYDEWNECLKRNLGSGLMITHINSSSSGFSMTPNNTYGKPNVTILPADGFILGSYAVDKTCQYQGSVQTITSDQFMADAKGDPFVGSKSSNPVTSVAAYKNYTGDDMVEKYPITDITRNDDGSITFKFMGGTPTAINTVDADSALETPIYTIDGRMVGSDESSLPHGIYIRNGHKFVK